MSTNDTVTPTEALAVALGVFWPAYGIKDAEDILAALPEGWHLTNSAQPASRELQAWRSLGERIRENAHASHDDGTPIDQCQKWVCFHVGVYLRHFESAQPASTQEAREWVAGAPHWLSCEADWDAENTAPCTCGRQALLRALEARTSR